MNARQVKKMLANVPEEMKNTKQYLKMGRNGSKMAKNACLACQVLMKCTPRLSIIYVPSGKNIICIPPRSRGRLEGKFFFCPRGIFLPKKMPADQKGLETLQ
jgi:hypothetical protein